MIVRVKDYGAPPTNYQDQSNIPTWELLGGDELHESTSSASAGLNEEREIVKKVIVPYQ